MTDWLPEGTVTVLFTDVVGSTDLLMAVGDEPGMEILDVQDTLLRTEVERHGGHRVKSTGDGVMVAFASARRAVACAVAIQRALADHRRTSGTNGPLVRMGLNTGEVVEQDADLFGAAVNAAARIAARAKGNEILISSLTRELAGRVPDVEFEDKGRVRLKGFPDRWRLFEVVWETEVESPSSETTFVGREAERAQLRTLIDRALTGAGGLVLIGGEPGVGKTRLVLEMAAEARVRGFLSLVGRCHQMETPAPYGPFVEVLEDAMHQVDRDVLRVILGEEAAEVARLLPELRRRYPEIPAPAQLPLDQERRYLFSSLARFLEQASAAQPLVVVLDDMQWSDDSSLLLLMHIAARLDSLPVVIVGTYRESDIELAGPFGGTLEQLLRRRLAERVTLRALPEESIAAMLAALSRRDPPPEFVRAIYRGTEGNPFFVEELYRHLAEEGQLFTDDGRWRDHLDQISLAVPDNVRLVIERRLLRLSDRTRDVLATAAVIGNQFTPDLLEEVVDDDPDALLDALDEAEAADAIQSASEGGRVVMSFEHELTRQTLLSAISTLRLQRLHLKVANAIERVHADSLSEHAADIAHHLLQAQGAADAATASRFLTMAGDRAIETAAYEDALRYFESALALHSSEDRAGTGELMHRLALAQRSLDRWDEALATWREALTIFEDIGDVESVGRISTHIAMQLSWVNRWIEVFEIVRRGLDALGDSRSIDRARLLSIGGVVWSAAGDAKTGGDMTSEGVAITEELGDDDSLGVTLTGHVVHLYAWMQLREAAEQGLRAARILRQEGALWDLATVLSFLQTALTFIGRFDEAHDLCNEGEALATRIGNSSALMLHMDQAAREMCWHGDIDRYELYAINFVELCKRADLPWIAGGYTGEGLARFWRGQWDGAMERFQTAVNNLDPGVYAAWNSGWAPMLLAYADAPDKAVIAFEQLRGDFPKPGEIASWGSWTLMLCALEAFAMAGEDDRCAALYPFVLDALETGTLLRVYDCRLYHSLAGTAASSGGLWAEAEEHFRTALHQAELLPVVIEQPEVRRFYARMLARRGAPGDRAQAGELLSEALEGYRRIGMPRHIQMAKRALAEL